MKALVILGVLLCFPMANAKTAPAPSPAPMSPTPSPAPAPNYVNLTNLLTVAGPFHKFLSYLISTKAIDTFQRQANNTEEGITIFVPEDGAFSSQKNPSFANLTQDQLKSLILFHSIPHYYTLADFAGLSQSSPVTTFAGGGYSINFTDDSGTVHQSSGLTHTKISRACIPPIPWRSTRLTRSYSRRLSTVPTYPPTPAPAPAPDISPVADAPLGTIEAGSTASSLKNDASPNLTIRGLRIKLSLDVSIGFIPFT